MHFNLVLSVLRMKYLKIEWHKFSESLVASQSQLALDGTILYLHELNMQCTKADMQIECLCKHF